MSQIIVSTRVESMSQVVTGIELLDIIAGLESVHLLGEFSPCEIGGDGLYPP